MASKEEWVTSRKRAATQVVDKAIDRVYSEVASLDGDALMDLAELYVAVLLVFNDLNKFVPGGHINPPKKKEVEALLKGVDLNHDGKLSRDEFADLVRKTMPGLVKRVAVHVVVYCSAVPLLVWATKRSISEIPHCRKLGKSLPGGLLATIFTVLFKFTGVLRN